MKKVYFLSTCSTCNRIIKTLRLGDEFIFQDIKKEALTDEQLEQLKEKTGSYESLFSRKAMKYRAMSLHEKNLEESDYRSLILKEYTFIKRPVIVIDDQIFVGNAKKTIESVARTLEELG